jgi:hypothetical protein
VPGIVEALVHAGGLTNLVEFEGEGSRLVWSAEGVREDIAGLDVAGIGFEGVIRLPEALPLEGV